jgi:hypothetical protein
VEVWLPYGDTEVSIMLPDPIDLRLQSVKLSPESIEGKVYEELYNHLVKIKDIRILRSSVHGLNEANFISRLLDKLELEYKYVDDDFNIVFDIARYDPIFGFKGSLTSLYCKDSLEKCLEEINSVGSLKISSSDVNVPSEVMYVDIVLDDAARLYSVYCSDDGSHWDELWNDYKELWALKSELAPMVIASAGGSPWDDDIVSLSVSLLKLHSILPDEGIGILIGDGVVREDDLDIALSLDSYDKLDIRIIYLRKLKDIFSGKSKRIYYFGSLPSTFLRKFNVKTISNLDRFIRTLPSRMKRSITIIENLYFLYPYYLEGSD